MKILHLSDTHGAHHRLDNLPDANIVVCSGDFCMIGEEREAIDFFNWFCDLSYQHKIFVYGNHNQCFYGANIEGIDINVHYLCNSGIKIDGVKFYGVPMFTEDCITSRQARNYANIPDDTDILITHSPAYGMLNLDDCIDSELIHYGSEKPLERVIQIWV